MSYFPKILLQKVRRTIHLKRLALVVRFAVSSLSMSQDLTTGGPDSVIAGPFGEPRMVMSEGGEWSYPIKVFENAEVEDFVPDITSPGWVSWHVAEFRLKGTYVTYLYIYNRKTRNTGRETLYVDTLANAVVVARPMVAPIRIAISKAPLDLARSIAQTTALVKDGAQRFHGQTIQEVVDQNRQLAARIALCSGPGRTNPDCSLSDSEFEKKHPTYRRGSPQMIPGAIPGVNCGIGTNVSCCCANDSMQSNSPALASAAPANEAQEKPAQSNNSSESSPESNISDGLYKVGGNVSAPIPVFTPDAEFSDEARRAKFQGVSLVSVVIDTQGNTQDPHVIRGIGKGLDEKAIEAVRRYKFRPAMKDGKTPVPVMVNIAVNFKLY